MSVGTFPPIPTKKPGRKSEATKAKEAREARAFAAAVETLSYTTGFAFGARGWGYYIEGLGHITKDDLDRVERILADLRKDGTLDPDVVDVDASRETVGGKDHWDHETPEDFAQGWFDHLSTAMGAYSPISFWEGLETYVEVAVEKKDLLQIYDQLCRRYRVPLTNFKGDSDINTRRNMLKRMKVHHEAGRKCVLLYVGDFDPKGLFISSYMKETLVACGRVQDVQWDASPVEVIRAGLTLAQINALGLTWIDNLVTGSGGDLADPKHRDHNKPYVEDYIRAHGVRKVEANALVADPDAAVTLLRDQLIALIPEDWPEIHEARLEPHRDAARDALADLLGQTS